MTDYDSFAETFSNSRKNMHWPEVDSILLDMQEKRAKYVLDAGCGNGRFYRELRKRFSEDIGYIGIDSSKGMISEAKKLSPEGEFLQIGMPDFEGLPEIPFDTIVLLASFHHLETREQRILCLQNLKKYLTPNGSIYMTNWNLLAQDKYQKNHRGNGDFDIKIGEFSRYYHGFTETELNELFEITGWRIIENRIFEGERNIFSKLRVH